MDLHGDALRPAFHKDPLPLLVLFHTAAGPRDLFVYWRAELLCNLGYVVFVADQTHQANATPGGIEDLGDGGDAAFGGYARYRPDLKAAQIRDRLRAGFRRNAIRKRSGGISYQRWEE